MAVGIGESKQKYVSINSGVGKAFTIEIRKYLSEEEIFVGTFGGDLHAEDNLERSVKIMNDKLIHIDALREICLDCQKEIIEPYKISTNTGFTGKKSRTRAKKEKIVLIFFMKKKEQKLLNIYK